MKLYFAVIIMRNSYFILSAVLLVLATSCKSIKSISSRDNSTTQKKKVKTSRKDVNFIDNIEVTPGSVVTSKHKTINTGNKANNKAVAIGHTNPDPMVTSVDIEKVDYLQLKYAVLLDATVEKLGNLPLLQTIDRWWGTRYCLGGSTASCIDCSAFTQILVRDAYSLSLPRTAQEQFDYADKIELEDLEEGDLVFFSTSGKRITHVGLYMHNNKFVHAATSGGVMISDLGDTYWKRYFKGCGRVRKSDNAAR